MFARPKVSIIVPVYNAEKFLAECLNSLIYQTLKEIEIICIDDGSTDESLEILQKYVRQDDRLQIIHQENSGTEKARNAGMERARGDYIAFVDADDWVDLDFYEKLYFIAEQKQADLVRACVVQHFPGHKVVPMPFNKTLVKKAGKLLCVNDHNVVVWDAIYKRAVIQENHVIFCQEKRTGHEDILWTAQMTYYAKRAFSCPHTFYHYRCTEINTLKSNVDWIAYINSKTLAFIRSVFYPAKEDYIGAVSRCFWRYAYCFRTYYTSPKFSKEGRVNFLKSWVKDWGQLREKEAVFNKYPPMVLSKRDWFEASEKELLKKLSDIYLKPVIVSLTSYPDRIDMVHQAVISLLNQTIRVDKIVLWLAPEQFPNKEKDLPKKLLDLISQGLTIDWYHDIKSYKKLIPALKKYSDAIIITVDDDVIYQNDVVEKLLEGYVRQPTMIHTLRAHIVSFKRGKLVPYAKWPAHITCADPSYNNFFTGVGGVLYPPHVLDGDVFDEEKFMQLSPKADDIWFWAMAVRHETKINLIKNDGDPYTIIPGSQSSCLWIENRNKGGNDQQLNAVFQAYPDVLNKLDKSPQVAQIRFYIPVFDYKKKQENMKVKLFGIPLFQIKHRTEKSVKYFFVLGILVFKKKTRQAM